MPYQFLLFLWSRTRNPSSLLALSIDPPITLGIDDAVPLHLWRYDSFSSCWWWHFFLLPSNAIPSLQYDSSDDTILSFVSLYRICFLCPSVDVGLAIVLLLLLLLELWLLSPWHTRRLLVPVGSSTKATLYRFCDHFFLTNTASRSASPFFYRYVYRSMLLAISSPCTHAFDSVVVGYLID